MFKFLRFVVFFLAVASLLVFVVLPAAISPLLTQYVRDMGVTADELSVSIDTFDPALLSGRAGRLHVRGTNVAIGQARVGELDVTLGNVSFWDRSFQSLSGQLDDVAVRAGGVSASAGRVNVLGPSTEASATGHFDSQQSEDMIKAAARRIGVPLDHANVVDGGLRLSAGGLEISAGIAVEGGALVLRPQIGGPILLLQPATSDPWRLEEAFVTSAGITLRGTVDAAFIAKGMAEPHE